MAPNVNCSFYRLILCSMYLCHTSCHQNLRYQPDCTRQARHGKASGLGTRQQTSQQHNCQANGRHLQTFVLLLFADRPSHATFTTKTSPCTAIMVLPAGRRLCPRSSFPGALPTSALATISALIQCQLQLNAPRFGPICLPVFCERLGTDLVEIFHQKVIF